jgi:alpha-glucosidase
MVANHTELYPGTLSNWKRVDQDFWFYCDNGAILHLSVLSANVLRFRFTTEPFFYPDFSYAIDPKFQPEQTALRIRERESYISIKTPSLECRLTKDGLKTTFNTLKGDLILDDDKGFHWEPSPWGGNIVQMSKRAQPEEYYYGLGDKTCHLNLRGERLQNWVTDCFGYNSHTDPLYRAIPFYYGLHEGNGYGVFFDNSFRTHFDFAKERHDTTSFWAQGGEMNYYFIYGPELINVAERYTELTGRPEMPPMWALGFHQCKWSYYPESTVKAIAAEFRERQIPCDAIYLDIDYMDGYRCFTWNHERFPDPSRMVRELKEQGFRTVVIIDPGIKIDLDYEVFQEGLEKGYFCTRPDGEFVKGKVWPGECFFPDFTRAEVRDWWENLFRDLIRKVDVDGVWNDMNEPAVFDVANRSFPDDVRHDYDGHPSSHRKGHNIYGMQMSRASYDGVKHYTYPKRPFMITRASYAGGQRFAAAWTGDNNANWEHLHLASIQSQRMSISGFSFIGSDIGGFNDKPSAELFTRWLQLAIFHPLFRVHSIGHHQHGGEEVDEDAVAASEAANRIDQEPWSFGEKYTAINKQTIELRYKMLPTMYTAFWQHVTHGTPVLRPLSFMDQHDPETLHRMEEFSLGDHLLACPISEEGADGRYIYLPKGIWYDYHTEQPIPGEQEIWIEAALDQIPMFVRSGGIIATAPVMQHTGEKPIEQMTLHAYYKNGTEDSQLYWDEGDGYNYEQGRYILHNFRLKGTARSLSITQEREGLMEPEYKTFRLVLHGMLYRSRVCLVDGQETKIHFTPLTTEVEVPWDFATLVIE